MPFAVTLPVRFGDCDAAGIGYYPRLLALGPTALTAIGVIAGFFVAWYVGVFEARKEARNLPEPVPPAIDIL